MGFELLGVPLPKLYGFLTRDLKLVFFGNLSYLFVDFLLKSSSSQLALFVSLITFLRKIGKINDNLVLAYTLERGKKLSLLSLFYVSNVILALCALSGMNIPMYNAMRRLPKKLHFTKFKSFLGACPLLRFFLVPAFTRNARRLPLSLRSF